MTFVLDEVKTARPLLHCFWDIGVRDHTTIALIKTENDGTMTYVAKISGIDVLDNFLSLIDEKGFKHVWHYMPFDAKFKNFLGISLEDRMKDRNRNTSIVPTHLIHAMIATYKDE